MPDTPQKSDRTIDLKNTQLPVRAECGHIFPVPIATMISRAEFNCPICGAADRFDEDAVRDARAQLEKLRSDKRA